MIQVGTLCSLLYSAPGNILDYVYASAKGASIKYAYSAFLRDTGTVRFYLCICLYFHPFSRRFLTLDCVGLTLTRTQYGFALPPEWIRPVGEETGAMIQYLAKFVAEQRGVKVPMEV